MSIVNTTFTGSRFEAEDVKRHTAPGGPSGLQGTVTIYTPGAIIVYGVSRLDGETDWTIDSAFRDGLPSFVNGFGARYLRTDVVADDNIVAALDELAGETPANCDALEDACGQGRR